MGSYRICGGRIEKVSLNKDISELYGAKMCSGTRWSTKTLIARMARLLRSMAKLILSAYVLLWVHVAGSQFHHTPGWLERMGKV